MFQDTKNKVSKFWKSKVYHVSVDHNDIFDHMYCYEPGNLLNIQNIMLKYQYLTK